VDETASPNIQTDVRDCPTAIREGEEITGFKPIQLSIDLDALTRLICATTWQRDPVLAIGILN
jgi:hypothetical protein